jgi:ATP-dependent Clp protease protease subunit
MNNKYYSLAVEDRTASIMIYGTITSWELLESDVSSYTLAKEIEGLDVDNINVYISSRGGEVGEGLAIYSMLKRSKAKVTTYVDGFACSIASVIFMAGGDRVMSDVSLLMIHNAWTYVQGNASDMRKQADALDTITQASINAYMAGVNISEDELKSLLDDGTWLESSTALDMGFATRIEKDTSSGFMQGLNKSIMQRLIGEPNQYTKEDDDIAEAAAATAAAVEQLTSLSARVKALEDGDGKSGKEITIFQRLKAKAGKVE